MEDQVVLRLEHMLSENKYYMMLIPYGGYRNLKIVESEVGQVCQTMDDPPAMVEIIGKAIVPIGSDISDALSMALYGIHIEKSFRAMCKNWEEEINKNYLLLLIVKEIMEEYEFNGIHKIEHRFNDEIVVPWVAITDNLDFMSSKTKTPKAITADGINVNVTMRREIHILSKEASFLIWRLYSISPDVFLQKWYNRFPEMVSLGFLHLKLKERKEDESTKTEGISTEDN